MIEEESKSFEEEGVLDSSSVIEINNQLNNIMTILQSYTKSSSDHLSLKLKKLSNITQVIKWYIENINNNNQKDVIENQYQLIGSLRREIANCNHTMSSLHQKIADLQLLNKSKNESIDANEKEKKRDIVEIMKRKMKVNESKNQIKEYQYLFYINRQNRQLKELHSKTPKHYLEEKLKKIKLFPHLKHLMNDCNSPINSIKPDKSRNRDHFSLPQCQSHTNSKRMKLESIETNINSELTQDKVIMTDRFNDDNESNDCNDHNDYLNRNAIINENRVNIPYQNRIENDDKIRHHFKSNKQLSNVKNHYLKSSIMQISELLKQHETQKRNNKLISNLLQNPIKYNDYSKK